MSEVKEVLVHGIENQQCTIGEIVKELTNGKTYEESYLFDMVFTMFMIEDEDNEDRDVVFTFKEDKTTVETHKIRMVITVLPERTKIKVKYAVDYFDEATIKKLISDYLQIMKIITENDSIKLKDINLSTNVDDIEVTVSDNFDFDF